MKKGHRRDDPLWWYLRDTGRIPLLTPEQELELAERVQAGTRAAKKVMDLAEAGADDETLERYTATIEDGLAARDRFVEANQRLVVYVAKRYHNAGNLSLGDLIQEGNFGLLRAVEKFDPAKGYRFATYAMHQIRAHIQRGIFEHGSSLRLPFHVHEQLRSLQRIERDLSTRLYREPTDEELAEEMGRPVPHVRQLQHIRATRPISIDAPIRSDEEDGDTFADTIADPGATPEELVEDADLAERRGDLLRDALDRALPESDSNTIRFRFGIDGDRSTLEHAGERLGVTKERARQVETRAMAKLLHPAFPNMRREQWTDTAKPTRSRGRRRTRAPRIDEEANRPAWARQRIRSIPERIIAILAEHERPMRPRELEAEMRAWGHRVQTKSIRNAIPRLEQEGRIERIDTDEGVAVRLVADGGSSVLVSSTGVGE